MVQKNAAEVDPGILKWGWEGAFLRRKLIFDFFPKHVPPPLDLQLITALIRIYPILVHFGLV